MTSILLAKEIIGCTHVRLAIHPTWSWRKARLTVEYGRFVTDTSAGFPIDKFEAGLVETYHLHHHPMLRSLAPYGAWDMLKVQTFLDGLMPEIEESGSSC